ncbi:MAG: NACHT domain-containing protein [Rhodocyclaceae bacterium]
MTTIVPRSCTEVVGEQRTPGLPLAALRERPAYVLLGEPGAGKTTAFKQEAEVAGTVAVTARDFVDLGPPDNWQGKPLFIDGLDEMRAGAADGRDHFGAIRRRLLELDRPPFRISCREADWRGASDQDALRRVAPDGKVAVVHLDDLTDVQIAQLLKENHGVDAPQGFIEQARERRLGGLLANPQTLRMLAEAVGPEKWPDSLAETYALACEKLAEEPNKRHRDARRDNAVATAAVLEAAGHVFAVQLLAGIAGFARDPACTDAAHPAFEAIGLSLSPALKQALTSRLFESGGQEERREPAHRSIAEFLGAYFLAHRIDRSGLPLGRVVALMTAEDGGVVADLRGLHAWLAVHSLATRPGCMARDPLGVVLYGDLHGFSTQDKQRLLSALGQEAKRYPMFRSQNWEASPFGALTGPDVSADFHAVLVSDARDEAHESLLDCVLEAITHGEPMPELGDALIALARDASHWPRNRHQAIEAYLRANASEPEPLLGLLDDIKDGKVEDGGDELMGLLLTRLYPAHLPATQVIIYLHPVRPSDRIGGLYQFFWEYNLVRDTPAENLPSLLDSVAADLGTLRTMLNEFHFNRFAGELLATGLEKAGETVGVVQLWNWLGIGLDEHAFSHLDKDHTERIAQWFNNRPAIYKTLLEYALDQCTDSDNPLELFYRIDGRFRGTAMSPEIEEWCFAKAAATTNEGLRRQLFNKGAFALVRRLDYTPELLDAFLAIAEKHPVLQTNVDEWLKMEWVEWRQENAQRKAQRTDKEQARIADWVGHFRKHQTAIENGTAPPGIMHDLAMIYFGRFREARGDSPIDRLQSFFGNDAGITLAALAGLRSCLSRADLPTVQEIINLNVKGRHHFIAEACLAGVEELTREGEEAVLALDSEVQARLVAFRLTHDFGNTPAWFQALVRQRPQVVAEVLVAYGMAMFKARKEHVSGLYPLAHDDTYAEVARHAAMRLLSAYPLRAKKDKLGDLGVLLTAAIQHADRQVLLELIATKLSRPSLDGTQRNQWLAAGLLLDPVRYEAPLVRHVGKNQSRAMQVAGFFESRPTRGRQLPELSESSATLLIRLLAPHLSPERPTGTGAHIVTAEMNAAELVRTLISRLGANPGTKATSILDTLLADERLHAWHGQLRHYRESQRVASREAHFRRASAADVVRTLANAEPANAADLHALLVQHLHDMAREDRDGNAMGYLRYWNVDSHGRPTDPRPENECQKRLYEMLKERLRPTGVDLQREHQRRENKRADISASFGGIGGFNVPLELKVESNRDLWRALRDQLMAHYVCDPGAESYGIYLVFWFGGKGMPVAADGGKRPGSAQELEDRLRATLKPDEQQLIGIIVMDCSPSLP